ncbi:hypothetical protein FVA74_05060 [Salinibacterium sp. dk2585]|uniref:hypothetical protein n=1 Tax=Salinibacterium sp. dk2585 TaxID=2603292 RepID=UPI0011C2583B|nr:hypothetical protein [Salinibacterium sp. dk2585]QEE61012.1 hypothetical protein FVA74_05060 [Salinibacterium sp. dk2585]
MAAAIVAAGVILPGMPAAKAAEVLRVASAQTITVADPVVGPGQYLKVTTDAAYFAGESDANGTVTGYIAPSTTEVWMPSDNTENWVQRVTAKPATDFYGDGAQDAAQRDWESTLASGIVQVTHAANGRFIELRELGGDVDLGDLPDAPREALTYLRATTDPSDEGVLHFAAELLRDGTMSAPQRAVLYEAIALLPSIRITQDTAVLDGRTGTAFSVEPTGAHDRLEIIIDPATGRYIGEREVTTTAMGAVPAGTTVSYSAVDTQVVSSAP